MILRFGHGEKVTEAVNIAFGFSLDPSKEEWMVYDKRDGYGISRTRRRAMIDVALRIHENWISPSKDLVATHASHIKLKNCVEVFGDNHKAIAVFAIIHTNRHMDLVYSDGNDFFSPSDWGEAFSPDNIAALKVAFDEHGEVSWEQMIDVVGAANSISRTRDFDELLLIASHTRLLRSLGSDSLMDIVTLAKAGFAPSDSEIALANGVDAETLRSAVGSHNVV